MELRAGGELIYLRLNMRIGDRSQSCEAKGRDIYVHREALSVVFGD